MFKQSMSQRNRRSRSTRVFTVTLAMSVALLAGCGGGGGLGGLLGGGLLGGGGGGGLGGLLGGGLLGGGGGGPLGLIIGILSNIKIINPLDAEFQAPLTPQGRAGVVFDQSLERSIIATVVWAFDSPGANGTSGPDGQIYVTERVTGRVRRFDPATRTASPDVIADLAVNSSGSRGLIGICFAPDGTRLFVTYCASTTGGDSGTEPEGLELRVSSFPFGGGVVTGPETILRTSACRDTAFPSDINSVGQCLIGPDSRLYFACGDLNSRLLAQDAFSSNFAGKVHRIELDGSIPADNPFGGNTTWVLGLRDPAFTFDSDNGQFWCVDNGSQVSDEINTVSSGPPAGANFGWPLIQGSDNTDPETLFTGSLFGLYTQPFIDYGYETADPAAILVLRTNLYGDDLVGNLIVGNAAGEQSRVDRWSTGGILLIRSTLFYEAIESGPIKNMFVGPDGYVYVVTDRHLYRVDPA